MNVAEPSRLTVFEAFAAAATMHGDRTAVVDARDAALTYRELHERTSALARVLTRRFPDGSAPLLLRSTHSLEALTCLLAASATGHALAPLDPSLPLAGVRRVAESLRTSYLVETIDADRSSFAPDFDTLDLAHVPDAGSIEVRHDAGASQPGQRALLITLSSGSTGDPKPIVFSNATKRSRAAQMMREFGLTAGETVLCASPLFHSLGQRLSLLPLLCGGTLVLQDRFCPERWLDAVVRHGVTFTIPVASHLAALREPLLALRPGATRLKALVSSSAHLEENAKRAWFDSRAFAFHEMYGASEIGTATRLSSLAGIEDLRCVGVACAGSTLAIRGDGGERLPTGVCGEIVVDTPHVCSGYRNRPDLDAAAFTADGFRTGDLGWLDERGRLFFADRAADRIVTGGTNVYPSDIESVLRPVDGVDDCVAIGVPADYFGEAVVAIIATREPEGPARTALERRLRAAARCSLTSPQQPLRYRYVAAMPLNSRDKIDRRALRTAYGGERIEVAGAYH